MAKKKRSSEETTRERILRVAADLFAQNGYHGTGMAELCSAADIGRGALYYQIGSKEDLLFDLCKRHVEEAIELAGSAVRETEGSREQFEVFCRTHLRILAERRSEVVVAERERHALTGELGRKLTKIHRQYRDILTGVLRSCVDDGYISHADPVDVMGALGMLCYTYMWLDPNGLEGVDEVAERFSQNLLFGLAGPVRA